MPLSLTFIRYNFQFVLSSRLVSSQSLHLKSSSPSHPLISSHFISSIHPSIHLIHSSIDYASSILPSCPCPLLLSCLTSLLFSLPSLPVSFLADSKSQFPARYKQSFLLLRKCLKQKRNPQRLLPRPRKHTPLTFNLSCPNILLYPFHIRTRPSSTSTHEKVVGTNFA